MARQLEADEWVEAYAKHHHLFCEIPYRHEGRTMRLHPDFLVRLVGDRCLLSEGKGRERLNDHAKQTAAGRWAAAMNADGRWAHTS